MKHLEWFKQNRATTAAIIVIAVVTVVISIQSLIPTAGSPTANPETNNQSTTTQDGQKEAGTAVTTQLTTNKTLQPAQKKTPYFFIHPTSEDQWIVKEPHDIAWSKAAGTAGYLTLVSALDKKPIGVITSNTEGTQTFYRWDGRYVFAGRYSPVRKEVTAGSYMVKFVPDAPTPTFTSEPFELVYADQVAYSTYEIKIQDNMFEKAEISVKRGDTVVFVNNDGQYHTIGSSHLGQTYLAPDERFTVNTALISTVSEVKFYDSSYSKMNFTLKIR